jgi:hypothetical protein
MTQASETQAIFLEKIQHLTPEQRQEVLNFIEFLRFKSQKQNKDLKERRQWQEIRGKAPYPLVGEDAQNWVVRTRRLSPTCGDKFML